MIAPATSRADALRHVRQKFLEAGLETPALDARLLLLAALGLAATDLVLHPETPLGEVGAERLGHHAARRLAREPVARILGEREFWGLAFALSPDTLVPRADTETVVETALALVPDRHARSSVLDLGTGSGCLLVALLCERPAATGTGLDRSEGALAVARGNAWRNGVGPRARFVAADWASPLRGAFDLIVSNPPYVASPAIATLDRDVRDYDPRLALDGGPDGLDAYRAILRQAPGLLGPKGHLVLEIGHDQVEAIKELGRAEGLAFIRLGHDLAGNPRCLAFQGGAGPALKRT